MFAAIAGHEGAVQLPELTLMAQALRGADEPPRIWCDEAGRLGVAAMACGVLPEDRFDLQPWLGESLIFACEARLDDRSELAARLGIEPARAAEMADSAILAHAYEQWGEQTPQHVYGDFAFIAWERKSQRLFAAVDHVGAMPLFYSQGGGRIFIATQLAAVMAHPAAPRSIDVRALGLLVAPRVGQGWTMFDDIRHLPGGCSAVFENGEISIRRWWNPQTQAALHYRDERDYVDQASSLLTAAVSARLRAVGSIAATLSGGLDSGLVVSIAARELACSGRTITAFTSVPQPGLAVRRRDGWDADDGPWAAAVASMHPNIVHELVAPQGLIPLDILPMIHAISRTPVRNTANHVWLWKVNQQARQQGARVVLAGEFGNATVSAEGMPRLRCGWEGVRYGRALVRTLRRSGRFAGLRCAAKLGIARLQRAAGRPGTKFLSAAFTSSYSSDLQSLVPQVVPRANFVRFMLRPVKIATCDAMAHFGVQWRDPMGDRRLMECLLAFPLHAFQAGGRSRGLAREIGLGLLPDKVRLRSTRGDQCADEMAWFGIRATRYRAAFDVARESRLAREILDLPRLAKALEGLFAGQGAIHVVPTMHRALDIAAFASAFESGMFSHGKANA